MTETMGIIIIMILVIIIVSVSVAEGGILIEKITGKIGLVY